MAHSPANSAAFNELDPHGFEGHGQHAAHVIIGPFTLRLVLAALLFFTVLTVGLAQLEVGIQNYFHIVLPWWVNVVVAMSIATVKALLVMAYFMQLRYDNPINTILMLFTMGALALFLFFTGLDLLSRDVLEPQKAGAIVAGGTGKQVVGTGDKPLVVAARERFMQKLLDKHNGNVAAAEAEFEMIKADVSPHHHGHGHDGGHALPDANRTFPRFGTSGALSADDPHHAPASTGH
jgi:caa(3)-type oxidase subunit IV